MHGTAMKIVGRLVFVSAFALGLATPLAADEAHPALYSFADLYRLTVAGAGADEIRFPEFAAEPQVRVAAAQPAVEPRFTISAPNGPRGWVLVLAGLAAAAWVAHRRLTYAY
jgi:hypothetical protein